MEVKRIILVKYGEVSLRKGNRGHHERMIIEAIRRNIDKINNGNLRVIREQGRFLIENIQGDVNVEMVLPHIQRVFGATHFCVGIKTSATDISDLCAIGVNFFREYTTEMTCMPKTFRVETKRCDKSYPLISNEISAAIGSAIFEGMPGIAVDLHKPDITLRVELRTHTYFYFDSHPGEGGLPYGSSGKGVALLSGGIDSPVAAYLAARRGVGIIPVYFHSPPFVSERAADKVRDLAGVLATFTGGGPMYIVPFTDVQLRLKDTVQPERLTLMLKRAMLRISGILAERLGAQCLITGDSVGQVASQTLHSIAAMESASTLPILRPLATMDKQQIIDIARRIGTFEISTRPFEDCCTLFVAKHPELKPKAHIIDRIESRIDGLNDLLLKAVDEAAVTMV